MTPPSKLDTALLAVLGLSACIERGKPCLVLDAETDDTEVTPCLDPPVGDSDDTAPPGACLGSNPHTDVGPCLDTDTPVGPCLSPPLDTDTDTDVDTGPCLSPADTSPDTDTAPWRDSDTSTDTGPCLSPVDSTIDADTSFDTDTDGSDSCLSFDDSDETDTLVRSHGRPATLDPLLEGLAARGALPPDVLARLRGSKA